MNFIYKIKEIHNTVLLAVVGSLLTPVFLLLGLASELIEKLEGKK